MIAAWVVPNRCHDFRFLPRRDVVLAQHNFTIIPKTREIQPPVGMAIGYGSWAKLSLGSRARIFLTKEIDKI